MMADTSERLAMASTDGPPWSAARGVGLRGTDDNW